MSTDISNISEPLIADMPDDQPDSNIAESSSERNVEVETVRSVRIIENPQSIERPVTETYSRPNTPTSIVEDSSGTCSSIFAGLETQLSTASYSRRLHSFTPHLRERMRRRLRYFFMNPIEKWRAKGRLPWKLGLQLVKIIFVTLQLILFGFDSSKFQQQQFDAAVTLRHLFLNNWDSVREVTSYPPATGPYAVYTKEEFFEHIDNVVKVFSNITTKPIGSFGYDNTNGTISPFTFCKTYYKRGQVFPYNTTLVFDNTQVEKCLLVEKFAAAGDAKWNDFSIEKYLAKANATMFFSRLINVHVNFYLKAVFVKSLTKFDSPDCYRYNVTIRYDNSRHDGQVLISLLVESDKLNCHVNVEYAENDKVVYYFRQVLNVTVALLCCTSIVLCCRSLYNAQKLRKATVIFFRRQYGKHLSFQDQFEFVDLWYVMMIANDVLILAGSAIKLQLEQRSVEGDQYNLCSILLGSGNLLVWIGVLRYLGFFRKYNILILTMKRALPNVLRFVLCALLIYCGFCFCGWVVFGPYHIKFRELSTTSECLFAMMNGDDLFATFAILNTESDLVWWFSRLYLYLFISLFIYIVISLFISVIMDSYETIKEYYETGFPLSDLQSFIAECTEDVSSGVYRLEDEGSSFFNFMLCNSCCTKEPRYTNI